ncbi:hypothetical protein V9T40_009490 [Parthenolecanium corni]|uniref:Ragulator complex protein LAMTOR1 n=1 Tax=Parthenolecanium corni TaxID=536013 RepID=A0AAN9TMU8_9HEMI
MGNCVSQMLQCCGLKQEESSQHGESGDLAPLIDSSGDCPGNNTRITCEPYYPVFPKKSEEQSDLNKILQDMATNVIDVASLGSYSLEQHEYRERMSFYITKLKSPMSSKSLSKAQKQELLQDVPNPDKVLISICSVPDDDLTFVRDILNQVDSLLENLKLVNSDALIIPFQIQN